MATYVPPLVLLLIVAVAQIQAAATRAGCEAPPALKAALRTQVDARKLQALPYKERSALIEATLERLVREYPREFEPRRRLIMNAKWRLDAAGVAGFEQKYRKAAAASPGDPLAQLALAQALLNLKSDEGVAMLEKLATPDFALPHLMLADFYADGKRQDKQKVQTHLAAYLGQCPVSLDSRAQWLLSRFGSDALQARVAAALRERLASEEDAETLRGYETLWGLEFKTRPPKEHDAVRKQVARDLERLARLAPAKPDAGWSALIIAGHKQAGSAAEVIASLEDKLAGEHPGTYEAFVVAFERWDRAHKQPTDQKDAAAWDRYLAARRQVYEGWIKEYPEVAYLRWSQFSGSTYEKSLSEADGLRLMERALEWEIAHQPEPYGAYWNAADFLLQRKLQPARALEFMREAAAQRRIEAARNALDDNSSTDDKRGETRTDLDLTEELVRAALAAKRPDAVTAYREAIEGPVPRTRREDIYWHRRALLAELDGRNADALAWFQKALLMRGDKPEWYRGKFEDELGEEARALWKRLGGTEAAFAVWSAPPAASATAASANEKPPRAMPAWELADLAGNTWSLKRLEGKSVYINVWATWCGPCQAELPALERLYRETRGRADIQIVTFDIDDDLGLVAPFMKEKGYTFPVIPAQRLVNDLLDVVGIPQNWIIDPRGVWRQTFRPPIEGFSADVLKRLEAVRKE
jgi:thiol-disulfide isomerase/thioredoxin